MAEPNFTASFLRRIVDLEKAASSAELDLLDRTLASIVNNPYLPERFAAFYDPQHPTFLLRAGPFVVEFAVDEASERVTFVGLFYRP